MIHIIKNTDEHVTFEKDSRDEPWFDHKCSNENLLKILKRENDTIERVQWADGEHIGSILHVYIKSKTYTEKEVIRLLVKERERSLKIVDDFQNKYKGEAESYHKDDKSLRYMAEREEEACRKIAITIDNNPLGLGKTLEDQIKNKYFKKD